MEKYLAGVLEYFSFFSYAPSFEEIHRFFPKKVSKKNLRILLTTLMAENKVTYLHLPPDNSPQYTLPQYSIHIVKRAKHKRHAAHKKLVLTIQRYISLLRWCPLVRFVGVTGASSMCGLQHNDDLDLCIISKSRLLWTTRFCVVILAKVLGIHSKTGVCLNLFFDEDDLDIPKIKQNSYVAHELLQMKTIIDKNHIHERFLTRNEWILRYYPNVQTLHVTRYTFRVTRYALRGCVDTIFKYLQLPIINRNRTAFSISGTQLWLFKKDFEKSLRRKGLVI